MPSQRLYESLTPWGDVVSRPFTFTIPAGGGAPTGVVMAPGDSVAHTGTGTYVVTVGDGPYFQAVGAFIDWSQTTITVAQSAQVTQATGSPCTSTITTFLTTAGTAAEPANAMVISGVLMFRKSPVP